MTWVRARRSCWITRTAITQVRRTRIAPERADSHRYCFGENRDTQSQELFDFVELSECPGFHQ